MTTETTGPRPAVIVMARSPRRGEGKTRLRTLLPDDERLRLQEAFLRDALDVARRADVGPVHLAYTPAGAAGWASEFSDVSPFPQRGEGLGARMLAALLRKKGDFDVAERLYRRALGVLPADHLHRGLALLGLGSLRMDRDDHQAVGPLLREALTILQQTMPEGHWIIAQAQSRLGGCLSTLGRFDEAEPLLLEGYAGLQATRGDQDERTLQAGEYLAAFYEASGQPVKVAAYRAGG